jgi:oxidoreductase
LSKAGLKLAAVMDVNMTAAQQLAGHLGQGCACRNLGELLATDCDLVIVAVPTHMHAALSRQALLAGHRVLCEKPLARSAQEAAMLVGYERGCLHVSTPYRFRDDVRALLDTVLEGHLGTILHVSLSWTRARGIPRPGSWYTSRQLAGGGVLADLGSHLLDLGLLLLGPCRLVAVEASTQRRFLGSRDHAISWMQAAAEDSDHALDVEDQAYASFSFDSGRTLELEASWAGDRPYDSTVVLVQGSLGEARLNGLFGYSTLTSPRPPCLTVRTARETEQHFPAARDPGVDFGRMLRGLLSSSVSQAHQPASGDHAHRVTQLIDRAYKAARSGPMKGVQIWQA